MNKIKISFIIPVYNAEKWVRPCVENLLSFHYCNSEILLIDDGSSDQSGKICDELALTHERVRCIHQENGGVSAARNRGIEEAVGDFLFFHDVDDWVDIALLEKVLENHPQVLQQEIVFLGIVFDYYQKEICYRSDLLAFYKGGILNIGQIRSQMVALYDCNGLNSVCTKLFKNSILKEYDIRFDTDMFLYEDLEFVLRALTHVEGLFNISEGIYHYRIVEGQGNSGMRQKRIQDLNQYLLPIEKAALTLAGEDEENRRKAISMLMKLYMVLIRERNEVSNSEGIRQNCLQAREWFAKWPMSCQQELDSGSLQYLSWLQKENVLAIMTKRTYVNLRHKLAVLIKGFLRSGK